MKFHLAAFFVFPHKVSAEKIENSSSACPVMDDGSRARVLFGTQKAKTLKVFDWLVPG